MQISGICVTVKVKQIHTSIGFSVPVASSNSYPYCGPRPIRNNLEKLVIVITETFDFNYILITDRISLLTNDISSKFCKYQELETLFSLICY